MTRRDLLVVALGITGVARQAIAARRDDEEECARIAARLRDIARQRRAGYNARQGRRLQARRDELEQRQREKCR